MRLSRSQLHIILGRQFPEWIPVNQGAIHSAAYLAADAFCIGVAVLGVFCGKPHGLGICFVFFG